MRPRSKACLALLMVNGKKGDFLLVEKSDRWMFGCFQIPCSRSLCQHRINDKFMCLLTDNVNERTRISAVIVKLLLGLDWTQRVQWPTKYPKQVHSPRHKSPKNSPYQLQILSTPPPPPSQPPPPQKKKIKRSHHEFQCNQWLISNLEKVFPHHSH